MVLKWRLEAGIDVGDDLVVEVDVVEVPLFFESNICFNVCNI